MPVNIARIEDKLVVVSASVGISVYDFDFDLHFRCSHPSYFVEGEPCVLRVGAISDYGAEYREKAEWGLRLINSPEEHRRSSELDAWYPLISDLTPRSEIFERLPDAQQVERDFGWPIFVKGSRQTSKHNPALSIAGNVSEYEIFRQSYLTDSILHWQKPVIRQFIELDPIVGAVPQKVRPSREFRTFWWRGRLVGVGQYWYQLSPYSAPDLQLGLEIAKEAAARLDVPFLVIDIARTARETWTIIECNDGQESGYVGLPPLQLWGNILELEGWVPTKGSPQY